MLQNSNVDVINFCIRRVKSNFCGARALRSVRDGKSCLNGAYRNFCKSAIFEDFRRSYLLRLVNRNILNDQTKK